MTSLPHNLTVAVAQPMVIPGACAENLRRMEPLTAEAARQGAELILFSECGLTGYDLKNAGVNAALSLDDPLLDKLAALATAHSLVIVQGMYERARTDIFNTSVAFYPDGTRRVQRKHNIIGHERENTPVQAAPRERVLFPVGGFACAILICADSGIEGIFEEIIGQSGNLILCPTAGLGAIEQGFRQADLADPERLQAYLDWSERVCFSRGALEKCSRMQFALATCNQQGWDEDTGFFQPGHSMVVDRTGSLAALLPGHMVAEHLHPQVAVGVISCGGLTEKSH